MRAGFYNIRDYGRPARRTQIKEFITRQHLDFVALQETMKSSFSPADLRVIDPLSKFAWHHSLVMGHSGGMLLGVNEDSFDVLGWGSGAFFLRVDVRQLDTSKEWSLFVVYGPANHRRSGDFLAELSHAVGACPLPLVVGGDFNLIRGSEDKNNDNIDWPRVHRFNDCIANLGLWEICRTTALYTWTNRQLDPFRCMLDRAFLTTEWETLFPLCSLVADTIIGSDHSPLILSSGEELRKRSPYFFFEKGWMERPNFGELVSSKWRELVAGLGTCYDSIERWQRVSAGLRQFLKG
jgi:exonuclease III